MSLSLLTMRPACAQMSGGWSAVPCDANGNPLQNAQADSSGFYAMSGTQSGQAATSYPKPLMNAGGAFQIYASGVSPIVYPSAPTSVIGTQGSGWFADVSSATLDSYQTWWSQVPPASGTGPSTLVYANGNSSLDLTGQFVYYFKPQWYGGGTPTAVPTQISLLLKANLSAGINLSYGTSGQSSGLTATATATDLPLNDAASGSGPSSVIGCHLVTVPVDPQKGVAQVSLSGQVHMAAADSLPYGVVTFPYPNYPSYASAQVTNGLTGANATASVTGSVKPSSASLGAYSTLITSAPGNPWDPTHPRFFSGTKCTAIAVAPALSGYVSHAQLLVGGTQVKQYYDVSTAPSPLPANAVTGTNQSSTSLNCQFDSTHFADGSSISIKMVVDDTNGGHYDSTPVTGNAYNKLYDVGNSTMTWGASSEGDVLGIFASNNMTPNPTTTDGKTAIEGNIPTYTALHTYTHGDPGNFGDCSATTGQTLDLTHYLLASDVSTAVGTKTLNQPPYNFVLFCACQCNADATLAGAFGIANGSVDRACLGFSTNVDNGPVTKGWAKAIWSDLAAGQSLSKAMSDATQQSPPMNQGSPATVQPYGDTSMTVYGTVYGGTTVGQLAD